MQICIDTAVLQPITFGDLKENETFIRNNVIFLKTNTMMMKDATEVNAVCLNNGRLHSYQGHITVERINLRIVRDN